MLRHRGVAKAEELGKISDRALAVDQLTDDQQPMAVRQRLQKFARGVGGGFHDVYIHFHTCVYTMIRIYSQAQGEMVLRSLPTAATKEVKTGT